MKQSRKPAIKLDKCTMVSSQSSITKVLFLLFVSFASTHSLGANDNDPEGSIRKGSDGSYSYLPAAAASSRTEGTPEISDGVIVGHEDNLFPSGTNETSIEPKQQQVFPSLNLRNKKEPKSKTRNIYRIGYSSMNGGVRGGAAGRANFGG